MSKSKWQGVLTVNNNTTYSIDVVEYRKVGMTKHSIATIQPNQTGWSNTQQNNWDQTEFKLAFYTTDKKNPHMTSVICYGPTDGLSVDRGDISGPQDIMLYGEANGKTWWQTGDLTQMQTVVFLPGPNNVNYNVMLTYSMQETTEGAIPPVSQYEDRL